MAERQAVERVVKTLRESYERAQGHRPDPQTKRKLRKYAERIAERADKKNHKNRPLRVKG